MIPMGSDKSLLWVDMKLSIGSMAPLDTSRLKLTGLWLRMEILYSGSVRSLLSIDKNVEWISKGSDRCLLLVIAVNQKRQIDICPQTGPQICLRGPDILYEKFSVDDEPPGS